MDNEGIYIDVVSVDVISVAIEDRNEEERTVQITEITTKQEGACCYEQRTDADNDEEDQDFGDMETGGSNDDDGGVVESLVDNERIYTDEVSVDVTSVAIEDRTEEDRTIIMAMAEQVKVRLNFMNFYFVFSCQHSTDVVLFNFDHPIISFA